VSNEGRQKLIDQLIWEVRAQQNAVDVVDQAAFDYLGINRTDGRCLDILERDGPMTAGRLAELAGLSAGAVTTVLDRLERAGYARRTRDTVDRRRVLVEVTPEVRQLAYEVYGGPGSEESNAFFDPYSDEELELLIDFTRRGREFNEAQLARIQALADKRRRR
jgi:DNA-binding MarR family transcriptional regulator